MAYSPRKFSAALAATVLTDVTGAIPAGAGGTYLITAVNRTATITSLRVAVTVNGTTPTLAEYIEYDAELSVKSGAAAGAVLSRWPVPLGEGWHVWAYTPGSDVSISVIGLQGS